MLSLCQKNTFEKLISNSINYDYSPCGKQYHGGTKAAQYSKTDFAIFFLPAIYIAILKYTEKITSLYVEKINVELLR